MADLYNLFRALETISGLEATRKEWQLRTGDGFTILDPILKPTGTVAESMPCLSNQLGIHYHDVIEHRDGTTEAVLRDEYYDCQSFNVQRHERAVLTPDIDRLAKIISEALGLEWAPSPIDLLDNGYKIGNYHPTEGFKFPVILSLARTTVTSEESLFCCNALYNGPFIFLKATPKQVRGKVEAVLTARNILTASLFENITMADDSTFTAAPMWHKTLLSYRNKVVPKSEPVMAFFETPPNARWTDISIRFIDGYTVYIDAGSVTGRYSYTEMGMANLRESKPSKIWTFLEQIAENHRFIDFHMGDSEKNKKWKYELASKLRDFFRIDDDPFWPYDPETQSWETKFNLILVKDR
ncbi:MAG: hypothetical protein ACYC27_19540 [Armatimonadota bacterium]